MDDVHVDVNQVAQLLNDTLSGDVIVVRSATDTLDRLSLFPRFPFTLLSITTGNYVSFFFVFSNIGKFCLIELN